MLAPQLSIAQAERAGYAFWNEDLLAKRTEPRSPYRYSPSVHTGSEGWTGNLQRSSPSDSQTSCPFIAAHWLANLIITESQNRWGWKVPLKSCGSRVVLMLDKCRTSCPRSYPDISWRSLRRETLPLNWAICSTAASPAQWRSASWCSRVSVFAHCLLACH